MGNKTSTTRRGRRRWGNGAMSALTAALVLAGAACGDDETSTGDAAATTTTTAGASSSTTADTGGSDTTAAGSASADVEAYCELARQLDEQEEFPSAEQIEELMAAAPEQIREDIEFVGNRFLEALQEGNEQARMELFADPELQQRFEPIEQFEVDECGMTPGPPEPEGLSSEVDESAQRVDVTATEYAFEFQPPSTGAASFVMTNEGEEPHIMSIGKLNEGVTLDEALEADDPASVLEWEAVSDIAQPGEEVVLTFAELTPGSYAMVCFIPAPDGEPHVFKGMREEFTIG